MYSLLVEVEVLPGRRQQFLEAALANAEASLRDELGCLRFDIIADGEDESRFRFEERYTDEEAFIAHLASGHYALWRKESGRCVRHTVRHAGVTIDPSISAVPRIVRMGTASPRSRGDGVETTELVVSHRMRCGTTSFKPGAGIPLHAHGCEELVRVLAGTISLTTEAFSDRLAAGDTTWVPPGVKHRFHDAGPDGAEILFTYADGKVTRTLAATGRTVVVGSDDDGGYSRSA